MCHDRVRPASGVRQRTSVMLPHSPERSRADCGPRPGGLSHCYGACRWQAALQLLFPEDSSGEPLAYSGRVRARSYGRERGTGQGEGRGALTPACLRGRRSF